MKLLDEQLQFEQQYCIAVKNVAREAKLPSMETLIKEWGWLRDIERTYTEKLAKLKHPIRTIRDSLRTALMSRLVKTYLVGLEPSRVSERLLEAIMMTPCQAADFATEPDVSAQLLHSVKALASNDFLKKLNLNTKVPSGACAVGWVLLCALGFTRRLQGVSPLCL